MELLEQKKLKIKKRSRAKSSTGQVYFRKQNETERDGSGPRDQKSTPPADYGVFPGVMRQRGFNVKDCGCLPRSRLERA